MENEPFDLLLRGGHVICPASKLDGVMDVAIRDGRIAAVQPDILPSSAKEVRRRARTAGAAGHDRHPCPLLPICQRPFRPERRHGGGSFGRHHAGRSGRPLLHDLSGLPPLRGRAGQDPGLCVPVVLSRGRAGGTPLPEPLQSGRHRHRCHGDGRQCQPRSRTRHQGPCRDRRLRTLGDQGPRNVGRDRAQDLASSLRPLRAALGPAQERAPMARTPTPSSNA